MAKKKSKRKFMKEMFPEETRGALHRELNVPEGQNIPASKLKPKAGESTRTKRRKNAAKLGARIARQNAKKKKK